MYKLTEHGVIHLESGAFIPNSVENKQWRIYQLWLKEGNTPEPLFDRQEMISKKIGEIRTKSLMKRGKIQFLEHISLLILEQLSLLSKSILTLEEQQRLDGNNTNINRILAIFSHEKQLVRDLKNSDEPENFDTKQGWPE